MRVERTRLHGPATLDEGREDLPPAFVRQAADLGHRGMEREAAFDLHRSDVLAAGEVPAAVERARVRLGTDPVALERFVACRQRRDVALPAGTSRND